MLSQILFGFHLMKLLVDVTVAVFFCCFNSQGFNFPVLLMWMTGLYRRCTTFGYEKE
jgi:hypothetical protein